MISSVSGAAPAAAKPARLYCELCNTLVAIAEKPIGKNHCICVVRMGKRALATYGLLPIKQIKAIKSVAHLEYELLCILQKRGATLTQVQLAAIDQYILLCTDDSDVIAKGRRLLAFHDLMDVPEIRKIKTVVALQKMLQALLKQKEVKLTEVQRNALTQYLVLCTGRNGEVAEG